MFSFIRKVAETMNDAVVYPKVALIFFVVVFAAMVWFALRANKNYISELEKLPLE